MQYDFWFMRLKLIILIKMLVLLLYTFFKVSRIRTPIPGEYSSKSPKYPKNTPQTRTLSKKTLSRENSSRSLVRFGSDGPKNVRVKIESFYNVLETWSNQWMKMKTNFSTMLFLLNWKRYWILFYFLRNHLNTKKLILIGSFTKKGRSKGGSLIVVSVTN